MDQAAIDAAIQTYYGGQFDEGSRLTTRSAQGPLEFLRTQELVTERIAVGSRVLDVGGGTGIHAAALAASGHDVVLIDPVAGQVDQALRHGTFSAQVGDARQLDFADESFDAVLLFGPLYHLRSKVDRLRCLMEAARVVVPGGLVFAAAIPRFIRHAVITLHLDDADSYPTALVGLLQDGTPPPGGRFPGGHFHTSGELGSELAEAGLVDVELHAVEGVAGIALEEVSGDDPELLEAALVLARKTGQIPGIRDFSNHVMAIGTVPDPIA